MRQGQFTVRFKDGTVFDLTPHIPFRDGAYENPSKHTRDIIAKHLGKEKVKEYDEYRRQQLKRIDNLICTLNRDQRT